MTVTLRSTLTPPPPPPHFRSIFQTLQNQLTVPFAQSFSDDTFEISIHCQVKGLLEMGFVWGDPNHHSFFFYTFSLSFVIHSLSLSTQILRLLICSLFFNLDGFIRHIRFDLYTRKPNFWEAKIGSRQYEKLENIRDKKELKESKKQKQQLLLLLYCAIWKKLSSM